MRLGIMGGTFDPIHYAHLFIAEEARARFALDRVLFIPNGDPPHKKDYEITPARHRYAMALIATYNNPAFDCSPMEIQRPGPSYTVDTLRLLRRQYPEAELFYLTGVDAVAEILTWRQPEEVLEMATFLAALRPGYDLKTLQERLPHAYLKRILLLGSTPLGISSTEIRERLHQNLPVRYLLPDGVLEYIYKHNLYAAASAGPNVPNARETTD
ncbi:MAG TPA: nicotinate-nucleotide adenylyltransferase [Chthonomonadaceae bacterium]|nr:nicotinate-nucleotide adenylyltransferase [Chthonomonadaceae bacterium]